MRRASDPNRVSAQANIEPTRRGENMRCRLLLWAIMVSTTVVPARGESAESAFKAGQRAEKRNDLDTAYQAFKRARDARPLDPRYMTAYLRLRSSASTKHIETGEELLNEQKLQDALTPNSGSPRKSIPLTSSVWACCSAPGPDPEGITRQGGSTKRERRECPARTGGAERSRTGLTCFQARYTGLDSHDCDSRCHLQDTRPARRRSTSSWIRTSRLPRSRLSFPTALRDALDMLAIQTKTFWRPLSANTILVSVD